MKTRVNGLLAKPFSSQELARRAVGVLRQAVLSG